MVWKRCTVEMCAAEVLARMWWIEEQDNGLFVRQQAGFVTRLGTIKLRIIWEIFVIVVLMVASV